MGVRVRVDRWTGEQIQLKVFCDEVTAPRGRSLYLSILIWSPGRSLSLSLSEISAELSEGVRLVMYSVRVTRTSNPQWCAFLVDGGGAIGTSEYINEVKHARP